VVEHRQSNGPDRDEPEPVTRGLAAMRDSWVTDRMGEVLALSQALIDHTLPDGITHEQARHRHAELKVQLYERMISQKAQCSGACHQPQGKAAVAVVA